MLRVRFILGTVMALVLNGCASTTLPAISSAAPNLNDDKLQNIDAAINSYIARKQMPGAVFLVHQESNQSPAEYTLRKRAYGALEYGADSQRTTISTVFDAASLTKPVATAPSILRLVEMGKIELDAPAAKYLPNCFNIDNKAGVPAITIRHLLTHTSSLPAGLSSNLDYSGDARAKVLMHACAQAPTHVVGKFFRYSDINFILLGFIVEAVSGMRLDQFADEQIFSPLKMHQTRFTPLLSTASGKAPIHKNLIAPTQVGGTKPLDSITRLHVDLAKGELLQGVVHDPTSRLMGGVAGHAGLFTTVDDLSRYARMLLNDGMLDGVQVLTRESVMLMQHAQTELGVTSISEPAVSNIARTAGWDMNSPFSRPRGTITPDGKSMGLSFSSFGHTGFTGCILWIDPKRKGFYVFLSNRVYPNDAGKVLELYIQLGDLVAQVLGGSPAEIERKNL
jgi:CubicO group peptidase (beta-lactamase class C family)